MIQESHLSEIMVLINREWSSHPAIALTKPEIELILILWAGMKNNGQQGSPNLAGLSELQADNLELLLDKAYQGQPISLIEEPAPTPEPNWEGFQQDNLALLSSLINQALAVDHAVTIFLTLEFKSVSINLAQLCNYWNASVAQVISPAEITTIIQSATTHNLPVSLNAQGEMVIL